MKYLYVFFATGFYSGYAPKAPGTVGSLVAAMLVIIAHQLLVDGVSSFFLISFILTFFIIGVIVTNQLEKTLGKDPSCIVIDEFVGMWIALLFLPLDIWIIATGFILFRLFDIFKPFFIGIIDQKVKGGLGVMLDDVLAGIYTNICLRGILWTIS